MVQGQTAPLLPPKWLENSYILLFALLPWSLDWPMGAWNLQLPTEPLLIFIGSALVWSIAQHPKRIRALVSGNPVAICSIIWILWMAIAACFSSMGIVSLKYCLVETGHWWVFGISMLWWPGLWTRVLPYLTGSMLGICLYTLLHHGAFSFRADQAILAPMPFFPDHTMYAAVLATVLFFTPTIWLKAPRSSTFFHHPWTKYGLIFFWLLCILLTVCRAALLSAAVSGLILAAFHCYKKRRYWIPLGLVLLMFAIPTLSSRVGQKISHDVSILERLNRWDCAKTMLQERPLTGFGPGTYQFQYLAFQQAEKMTRISITKPLVQRSPDNYGRGGGAHSEYAQAAAETGLPGFVIWCSLIIAALFLGFRQAIRARGTKNGRVALLLVLGLLSFFLHGLVNNFMHDANVAALVWGAIFGGIAYVSQRPASQKQT